MSRELVAVGDSEPIEVELYVDEQPATGLTDIQVRAYIVVSGVKNYWNGSAFTTTDATLTPTTLTLASALWIGSFTYPSAALNKEVFFEARAIGNADVAGERIVDSRWVVQSVGEGGGATPGAG